MLPAWLWLGGEHQAMPGQSKIVDVNGQQLKKNINSSSDAMVQPPLFG